jgi:hypothetical protein
MPVTLKEVTPREAIFRGCTGGDCSSQYSFPYPNDPHERVFFIYGGGKDVDKEKGKEEEKEEAPEEESHLKGYVSATEVNYKGKKALYVITIAGNRVSAGDTKLILMALEKAKEQLGFYQILLPAQDKINGLINFPAPRGVYEQYVKGHSPLPMEYQDQLIRRAIETFDSKNNSGAYDHMESNAVGIELKVDSKERTRCEGFS